MSNRTNKFLKNLRKNSEALKPSTELFMQTLEKINVTNQELDRNTSVESFYRKVVTYLRAQWQVVLPISLAVLLLVVVIGKSIQPVDETDVVLMAFLTYSDDTAFALGEDLSNEVSILEQEITKVYTEDYENTEL